MERNIMDVTMGSGRGGKKGRMDDCREKRRKRGMREKQVEQGKDAGSEGRTDGYVFVSLHLLVLYVSLFFI